MAALMGQMVARHATFDNGTLLLSGIWDVHALTVGGGTFVYGAGFSDNDLSGFRLNANGSLSSVTNVADTAGLALGGANGLASVVLGGRTFLFANGNRDSGVTSFEVGADGTLSPVQTVFDGSAPGLAIARPPSRMAVGSAGDASFLIVPGHADDGFSVFRIGADGGLTNTANVTDLLGPEVALDGAYGVATAQVGGRSFIFVAGGNESGVSSFELAANGSVAFRDSVFDSESPALRISGAYDVVTATVDGATYLIAAGYAEDGLSVFRVGANGDLTNATNLSGQPNFLRGASGLSSFQLEGETFIAVSGYRGGTLGLLHLDADGTLSPAASVNDTGALALGGSLMNAFTVVDGVPYLLGAGANDRGISVFELGAGNDDLQGTADADLLMGLGGDDVLTGDAGADRLLGGRGADRIHAGAGDHVDGGAGSDRAHLTGSMADYEVSGTVGDFTLTGLRPGLGTVRLVGIESLSLGGQVIAPSSLLGGVTIHGTSGNDIVSATRTVPGQPSTTLFTDVIFGHAGNDRLDGGGGEDLLYGGAGNDIYTVDSLHDVASEANRNTGIDDGGTDLVNASANHVLGAFVENLTLAGVAASGTGNALGNRLTGNAVANLLRGEAGNDIIQGLGGDDWLRGDAGNDNLQGGDGSDLLFGGVDNDTLSGGAGIDRLQGDAGNDRLDGGTGADAMLGGLGSDSYTVDNLGDATDETGGDGLDTVTASVSFTLGAGVENLTLTGLAAHGTGNALANRITGTANANQLQGLDGNDALLGGDGDDRLEGGTGADSLQGQGGNDRLLGGEGNDRLAGGVGSDDFIFNQAPGAGLDTVVDFDGTTDRLVLDAGVFGGLGLADALGQLLAGRFHLGTDAADADDRVVYDQARGRVFFDADGAGATAKVQILGLTAGTVLTHDDVFVL